MDNALFFESAGDERGTPQAFFDTLNTEFQFELDAAASDLNNKCDLYFGKGGEAFDALEAEWGGLRTFLNPPYSLVGPFIEKAVKESALGATVVALLPVRTDTKWWHNWIWNRTAWGPQQFADGARAPFQVPSGNWRQGIECRFISGRLGFSLTVPDAMRTTVKDYARDNAMTMDLTAVYKVLAQQTGLPKMAIDGILKDWPDEDLLANAPFPSCVVIFRLSEIRP